MDGGGVNFVYFDYNQNTTVVLRGSIELKDNASDQAGGGSTHAPASRFFYDGQGALFYIVAVIVVYGLSIIFLIVILVGRKSHNKTIDNKVAKFLKGLEGARQQEKVERVMRMRLNWLGNFITPRYGSRRRGNIVASDIEDYPEWPCLEPDSRPDKKYSGSEASQLSLSSYTIIPATTVPLELTVHKLLPTGSAALEHLQQTSGMSAECSGSVLPCAGPKSETGDEEHGDCDSPTHVEVKFPKDYRPRLRPGQNRLLDLESGQPGCGWQEQMARLASGSLQRLNTDRGDHPNQQDINNDPDDLPSEITPTNIDAEEGFGIVHGSASGYPAIRLVRRHTEYVADSENTISDDVRSAMSVDSNAISLYGNADTLSSGSSYSSEVSGDLSLSDIDGTEVSYDTETDV